MALRCITSKASISTSRIGSLSYFAGSVAAAKRAWRIDTLYAEGQRRYIETFSAYTRQYLQRLERPAAEKITGLPPAVAVTHKTASRSSRTTVGSATETNDYLRLLFAKIGRVVCQTCGHLVRRESPQSAAEALAHLPAEARFMVTFGRPPNGSNDAAPSVNLSSELQAAGFVRRSSATKSSTSPSIRLRSRLRSSSSSTD